MSSLLQHKTVGIRKPTRGHQPTATGQIRTDHELVDRLQQWKHVTKSLLHYYKGLVDIENATSRSTSALTETIQVPFHEGHVFSPDGWQAVLYDVRDTTKLLAERHSEFASTIERTVVRDLEQVRTNIKNQIHLVEKEASIVADEVEKERETSKRHLLELQNGIDTFENSATQMLPQKDPYLSHHLVENQLKKQVRKENDLQAAVIRFQQQQPAFEENVAKDIQAACKIYDEEREVQLREVEELQEKISEALQRVDPRAEWEFFASRTENSLIDPHAPQRSISAIQFPGQNHASTNPLKVGHLERKKRFSKKYTESFYVLTPSGYLHERRTSNQEDTTPPAFSLFLPECTLSAPAKESDRSHKFHVTGNKAVKSSAEAKMKNTLRFGGKELAYTFRCRTHAEMMGWWEVLDQLSRDTKTERETVTRVKQDPVGLAVAKVGYAEPTEETEHVAGAIAGVPGTEVEEVSREELEAEEAREQEGSAAARAGETTGEESRANTATTSIGGQNVVLGAPVVAAQQQHAEHEAHAEHEEDSEDGGGSSEEEYASDDEMAIARTAPTTPAPITGIAGARDPMEDHRDRHLKAETLPAYVGSGTGLPEKQALTTEAKGAPVLGNPVSNKSTVSGSSFTETLATSGNGAHEAERIETANNEAAPAALATTSAAS
ncbi:hypothetical protein BMF94_2297 [Rhodotorula taiwanensis]|uniref:PH domain-containing protein n=1 Tax=Rhodotorula taiwanensis TaxID=741276 RepID=A0A2S5BCP3_9BASI|nr:hypothetical protein BMF94_2297 [Rhodotorula taiwanensis]